MLRAVFGAAASEANVSCTLLLFRFCLPYVINALVGEAAGEVGRRFESMWQVHDKVRIALCDLWTVRPSLPDCQEPALTLLVVVALY